MIRTPAARRARRPRLAAALAAACLVLLLAALGGCGKKGPPELPEGTTDQYPRQYPNPDEP
jgi:predicted small lipoprotein YifL